MILFPKNIKDKISIIPILAISLFFLLGFFGTSLALSNSNISGFAWGAVDVDGNNIFDPGIDGGIGWLSFSCTDTSVCDISPYGLNIDTNSGDFSGYAWSSNVGWISFNANDVAGCPFGTCTPNVNLTDGKVIGWARACTVFVTGCNGSTKTINGTDLGAWDGWIELSGVNHESPDFTGDKGVTFDLMTGNLVGFAWGGNANGENNIGWIKFGNPVSFDSGCSVLGSSLACAPYAAITATPTSVNSGQTFTINWNSSNTSTCSMQTYDVTSGTAVQLSANDWTGVSTQPSSSQLIDNTFGNAGVIASINNTTGAFQTIQYDLICGGNGVTLPPVSVSVYVAPVGQTIGTPVANIFASAPSGIPASTYAMPFNGTSFSLVLSSTLPPTPGSTSTSAQCNLSADQTITDTGWTGNTYNSPIILAYNSSVQTIPVTASTVSSYPVTFSLTNCSDLSPGTFGPLPNPQPAIVTKLSPPSPTAWFTFFGSTLLPTATVPGHVQFGWGSTNTSSCAPYGNTNPAWWVPTSSAPSEPASGQPVQNLPAGATATTVFTLQCTSSYGLSPVTIVLPLGPNTATTSPNGNPVFQEF